MFSHFFQTICIHFFSLDIRVFLEKLYLAFFSPIFCHDIRVFIKNVFSHFFQTFFSIVYTTRYLCVSVKNYFSSFFHLIFWSRYSCVYKKRDFALFPDDFFPSFFAYDIRVIQEKNFSRFFSPHFLVTIFICL